MAQDWEQFRDEANRPNQPNPMWVPGDPIPPFSTSHGAIGRGNVQRVKVVGYEPIAMAQLDASIGRLQTLGRNIAPELGARHVERVAEGLDRVNEKHQKLQANRGDLLRSERTLQEAMRATSSLQGDALDEMLNKYNMMANKDDIHKNVVYHYLNQYQQPQPAEAALEDVHSAFAAVQAGTATPEQAELHQRIARDLAAEQVQQEQKANKEYERRIALIQQQVKEEQNVEKTNKRVNDLLSRGTGYVSDRLRAMNLMVGRVGHGEMRYVDETGAQAVISENELGQLLQRERAGQIVPDSEEALRLQAIRQTIGQSIGSSIGRGETSQDTQHFRIREMFQDLARGNFGGALGEAMQRIPSRRLDELNEWARTSGDAITARLGGNMLARAAGGILPSVIGGLTTPAGLIALQQGLQRSIAAYQQTRQIGMITGQGFEAGAQARLSAFTQAINPFDLLSYRQALEIQRSVREQGFTGRDANDLANVMGDVVNHLGTDWKEALQATLVATQEGGSSLKDFRDTLMGLRDMAHETGTSVDSLQKGLAAFSETAIAQGATQQQATLRFTAAQRALARTPLGRDLGAQRLQQFLTGSAPLIAMQAGVPAWQAMSMNVQQWARGLDRFLAQLNSMNPFGSSPAGMRRYAEQLAFQAQNGGLPIFAGLQVDDIIRLLRRGSHGGFERGLEQQRAENLYQQARRAAQPHYNLNTLGGRLHALRHGNPFQVIGHSLMQTVSAGTEALGWLARGIQYDPSNPHPADRLNQATLNNLITEMERRGWNRQQIEQRVQVEINLHKDLRRFLTASTAYEEFLQGKRGGQGVQRPPGQ